MNLTSWKRLPLLIHRVTSRDAFWWIAGISVVLATGIFLSWRYWGELHGNEEALSTTVRNVGLVIGGVVAILLAVWRSMVVERQADTARRQSETAERGLLNERYQKGAEMLGSKVLPVRLGGIYALQRLAEEHREEYHIQIMRLFCAFVRNPTEDSEEKAEQVGQSDPEAIPTLRADIQAVMEAIGYRSEESIVLEKKDGFRLNLGEANLSGLWLIDGKTDLSGAILWKADLSNARFLAANLSYAIFWKANLSNTILLAANLSGANLSEAAGLTQHLLNEARADHDKPPSLEDALDAKTGKPLEWRGRPLEDK